MLKKIILHLFLLICISGTNYAQSFELIDHDAERILVSLSDNKPVDQSSISLLRELVSSVGTDDLADYSPLIGKQVIDSLANHLSELESQIIKIPTDSAFVLFNEWYLHFQNVFYEYEKNKCFSSDKPKIILFSTSMSCACTLKMSRDQTVDLIKFMSDKQDDYDYWVIDSYWNNELQIKYEEFFSPSVLILNNKNILLNKIEYDEKMIDNLTKYLDSEAERNVIKLK